MEDPDPTNPAPGDDTAPGPAGIGENICPECGGSGKVDGQTCYNCSGHGKVLEGIAGA
jgi:hypothetical protein